MFIKIIKNLLPYTVLAIVFLTIYAVAQQDLRLSAYDPQLQMARDASSAISNNQSVFTVLQTSRPADISKSLATYYIVYDSSGKITDSNAQLDGWTPTIPSGVLDAAKKSGEDKVTWQPKNGVRSAVVVESVNSGNSGYVAVGRSLSETENRIEHIGLITLCGLIISTLLLIVIQVLSSSSKKHQSI